MPLSSPLVGGMGGPDGVKIWQDAIVAWVQATSGRASGYIYWADQKIERPPFPFITLSMTGPTPVGSVDRRVDLYDATRPAYQEMESRVEGERTIMVTVQVWGAPVVSDGINESAMTIASRVRTGIRLPGVNQALNAAGLGPHDIGAVVNLGKLLGTDFEGRASFEANFYVRETISEFGTYIATANVTNQTAGETSVIKVTQ